MVEYRFLPKFYRINTFGFFFLSYLALKRFHIIIMMIDVIVSQFIVLLFCCKRNKKIEYKKRHKKRRITKESLSLHRQSQDIPIKK